MIRNFFTIAWRNLMRNKIYAFINIAGLSLGLTCAILIILYTKDEVSYDKFHPKGDRIYRIVNKHFNPDGSSERGGGSTSYFHGPTFASQIPEMAAVVRIQADIKDVKKGGEVIREEVMNVDSNFLEAFNFPLLHGNVSTALDDPSNIVISEDLAEKYFATTDAVGKTLEFKTREGFKTYTVSAVSKKCPQNSSIKFNVLLPMEVPKDFDMNDRMNWFNFFLNTFVVLAPGASQAVVEKKMHQVYALDAKDAVAELARNFDEKGTMKYYLQPFADIHLNPDFGTGNGLIDGSNPWYSYVLIGIAVFILLIACINFINLTIARSLKRAREIGVRKVVGSNRQQLMLQFIWESFLLCLLAFGMALVMAELLLPMFNKLANKSLSLSYLLDGKLVAGYLALLVCTALLAGFYPALVLSSFDPVKTLYGRFQLAGRNYLQKGLVVLQFSLATILIIGTITIYRQFDFMLSKPLGYNDQHLVTVEKWEMTRPEFQRFRSELMKDPNIVDVSPRNSGYWGTGARVNGTENISFAYETAGTNHLTNLQIPLVQGRNFDPNLPTDSTESVLVNETFVKAAKWKQPLGQIVDFFWANRKMKVIGVVKDHHFASLTEKIEPQLITVLPDNPYGMAFIKLKPGSDAQALEHISKTFKSNFSFYPYSYNFRADTNRNAYESEAKWKQMMMFGAILTIFISCIGLFGLSVLNAEKRVKEIGIRKVMGASVRQIAQKLSAEYLVLVSIALLAGIPAAWLAIHQWLEGYPYRIEIGWSLFALAAAMVMLIAFLTVSFQAIRAGRSNPVKSLRTE